MKKKEEPYFGPNYKPKNAIQQIWKEILVLFFGLFAIHVFLFTEPFNGQEINSSNASKFGDFVGGYLGALFALISVIYLISTFRNQRVTSEIDKFETRFFELIGLHRDNVLELSLANQNGKKIFVLLIREFRVIMKIVEKIFRDENLNKKKIIEISYLTFFYGIGPNSTRILKSSLTGYNREYVEKLISKLESKRKERKKRKKRKEGKNKVNDFNYFGGHQSRLGHYYRHLFQSIYYCHNKKIDLDKYDYVKLIRAQLSNHEQALLMLNSVSKLGKPWSDESLIKTYRLIKNIPENFFDPDNEIDIKKLYPNLIFEYEEEAIKACLNEKKHISRKNRLLRYCSNISSR